jgi:hypothetical protein
MSGDTIWSMNTSSDSKRNFDHNLDYRQITLMHNCGAQRPTPKKPKKGDETAILRFGRGHFLEMA